jgi:signal transduction histidine kinase
MAEDHNKLGNLSVKVFVEEIEPDLPEDLKLGFFRVAQEALIKIRKHARATLAELHLRFSGKGVLMVVSDNGVGFDTREAFARSSRQGSLGLMSMQERADLINAVLRIESRIGRGSRVVIRVKT